VSGPTFTRPAAYERLASWRKDALGVLLLWGDGD
jgi:hypothetical protein